MDIPIFFSTFAAFNDKKYDFDAVISGADYAFTESLLPDNLKNYTQDYWQNKTFAPSCLIYYLGINEKIDHLNHHTLFFEEDFSLSNFSAKVSKSFTTIFLLFFSIIDLTVSADKGNNSVLP